MHRSFLIRIAPGTLSLGVALLLAAAATGSEAPDETERWVPSGALFFGAVRQEVFGSIASSDVHGPPRSTGGCEGRPTPDGLCAQPVASKLLLTPNVSGTDTTTAALVGASLELMTPRFVGSMGRPRLFAHADGSLAFTFKRKLAGEGTPPGIMDLPPPPPGDLNTNISEGTITGQGNRAFYELQTEIFSAGAGLAFSFDVWGRRIRVKPSFEYLLQEVEFEGIANRAVQLRGSNQPRPDSIDDYRLLSFAVSESNLQHGIGGGLELEADASRLGPFMLSVFLNGRYYKLLGDLDETLCSDTNLVGASFSPDGCENRGPQDEYVVWTFQPEDTVWRGGVGLRFRYLPE